MSDVSERLAQAERDRANAAFAITQELILGAMDPNGATMKLCAIIAYLHDQTGYSEYALSGNVQNKLRHMRRAGLVELTKGPGAGWRITGISRPRIDAVARAFDKIAPPCPRCGKNDDTVPATNYGRPTGGWQHRCCGVTTWPGKDS